MKKEALKRALAQCAKNDKTVFTYYGNDCKNRQSEKPPKGKRFQTPFEIAQDILGDEFWKYLEGLK